MCLTVYVTASVSPPLVEWNPERPAFNVAPLESYDEAARRSIDAPFVVSAGAHTRCGCGFSYDDGDAELDVLRSRQSLQAYLEQILERSQVELFVCWNGDPPQTWPPPLVVHPSELVTREDWLVENSRTRLVSS